MCSGELINKCWVISARSNYPCRWQGECVSTPLHPRPCPEGFQSVHVPREHGHAQMHHTYTHTTGYRRSYTGTCGVCPAVNNANTAPASRLPRIWEQADEIVLSLWNNPCILCCSLIGWVQIVCGGIVVRCLSIGSALLQQISTKDTLETRERKSYWLDSSTVTQKIYLCQMACDAVPWLGPFQTTLNITFVEKDGHEEDEMMI